MSENMKLHHQHERMIERLRHQGGGIVGWTIVGLLINSIGTILLLYRPWKDFIIWNYYEHEICINNRSNTSFWIRK
jgi:hypothetical protein